MKLLISNQHGAMVMALLPFLCGVLSSTIIWQHVFLLGAWLCLYLVSYPLLNLFKGRNLELYRRWIFIYSISGLIFAMPALYYNWQIIYFLLAMLPFGLINIYYTKQKNERALNNDLAAIAIFALAGMAAYYFYERHFDQRIWQVALYPSLFFIGTTLYVKSVLRERKNPRYLYASILFHACCVLFCLIIRQYALAFTFALALCRAVYIPKIKLSTKQVGILEMVLSLLFLLMLVCVG